MATSDSLDDFIEKKAHVNGINLTYFERGRAHRDAGPTLLFAHATGFHARIWDKIVRQFPDCHVVSLDQRGHGRSEKKRVEHWSQLIADLSGLIATLDLQQLVGVGHSMGGHAMIGAAGAQEDRFRCVVAIDPVILPETAYHEEIPGLKEWTPETHPTAKRRREFASPEEMADRLRPKGSYGIFDPDILLDYCRYGLVPNETGTGYLLACPPEVEASIYLSSRSNHGIYDLVRTLEVPVVVVRAKEPAKPGKTGETDFASSPTWPGLAAEFRNARDVHYPDKTHFLPMQIPDEIARLIREEIEDRRNPTPAP